MALAIIRASSGSRPMTRPSLSFMLRGGCLPVMPTINSPFCRIFCRSVGVPATVVFSGL